METKTIRHGNSEIVYIKRPEKPEDDPYPMDSRKYGKKKESTNYKDKK